jgi:hypothetical protein
MPIEGYGGLLGSGKTLGMTIFSYLDYKEDGMKVYSNFKTTFSEMINPLDLLKFKLSDCVLMLDELETIFDSRNSGSTINQLFSYFFLQSRKKNVKIRYTAQMLDTVDKRGRYVSDFPILCKALPTTLKPDRFVYVIHYGLQELGRVTLKLEKAKPFFEMYDTTEIIVPFVVNKDVIDNESVIADFEASPTKKAFIQLLKKTYPQIPLDSIGGCYDFLNVGDKERAFRCLTY